MESEPGQLFSGMQ